MGTLFLLLEDVYKRQQESQSRQAARSQYDIVALLRERPKASHSFSWRYNGMPGSNFWRMSHAIVEADARECMTGAQGTGDFSI